MMQTDEPRSSLSRAGAWACLTIFAVLYTIIVSVHYNQGYLDFGDGNYMYISWRMSHGAMLYRDVLAPQPPMHLLTGAVLAKIGETLNAPIGTFRVFSMVLHLATMLLVYLAAIRISGGNDKARCEQSRLAGVLAALIYLLLPLGFWWTLGYQSEPLEMFFFVWSFLLFVTWEPRKMIGAGVCGALTPLTNMTAAPYVLFNIGYLAVRRRRVLLHYVVPVVVIIGLVTLVMELWTGAYLENVIFNQVGSFPRKEFLGEGKNVFTYAIEKLVREGRDVLHLEGGYILLGVLGLLLYATRGAVEMREYVAWYSFFAFCSIIYVSKGGTEDYIFTIGEPFVAILGGYFLYRLWTMTLSYSWRQISLRDLSPIAGILAVALLALMITSTGLQHSWRVLKQKEYTYELDEYTTLQMVDQIKRNSRPEDLILSPPYYAYLAQRRLAEDYSELFLWSLKYHNEKLDKVRGRGVETVEKLARLLNEKKIAFIILDQDQTGRIPEIRSAIEANYRPLRSQELRTLNTRLQFYAPR